jgi:hypothetical protein
MRVEGQKASINYYPRKDHRRQKCATLPNIRGTAQPSVARSVMENSASSGTTPGGPLSVQRGALTASRHARKATASGYADFKPPDSRNQLCATPPSAFRPSDMVFCFALGGAT